MRSLMHLTTVLVSWILIACTPTPQQSQSPEILINSLAPGVWLHTSFGILSNGNKYPSNGLIVRNGDHLVLIDTAWGEANTVQLLAEIMESIKLPVATAFVTHSHDDRTGGIGVLQARGVKVFSHPLTIELLASAGEPLALPDEAIHAPMKLGTTYRKENIELVFPGHGHAADNIVVWLPDAQLLFGGCALRSLDAGSMGNTREADLRSWLTAMEFLGARYAPELVVPGHGQVGGAGLIAHTAALLRAELAK